MNYLYILCLIGFAASASPIWQLESGKEYLFQYEGRIVTGIPEIDSHYAGLGIQSEMVLQVKSESDVRMALTRVNFTQVNDHLHPHVSDVFHGEYDASNWRYVDLKEYKPASGEIEQVLKSPVVFSVQNGEVAAVTVSSQEPQWAVNFKKALVILFQTKMETSPLDLETNTISKDAQDAKSYWKVSETTMMGICDVTYQINELPEYTMSEYTAHYPALERCESGQKYFEVVKTKDVDSCQGSPIYTFAKPSASHFSCNSYQCLSNVLGSASSVTRYLACGPSKSSLTLRVILNEGEMVQSPVDTKSEPVITGVRQVAYLKHICDISQELPQPAQPKTTESLMYEYVSGESLHRPEVRHAPHLPANQLKSGEIYKYLPRNFVPNPDISPLKEKFAPQHVMEELKKEFLKVIQDLSSPSDLPSKEIPLRLTSLIRGLALLKFEDIKTLYDQLKQECQDKQTLQNIYFDSVMVSGTAPAVVFLKEMITSGEMSTTRAVTTLMMMPHHVITPTEQVITSFLELVSSDVAKQNAIFYNTAVLSASNMIQKACLEPNKFVHYPVSVFGEFCNHRSEIVTEKWISYLKESLYSAQTTDRRNALIVALGALSHREIVPILLPIVQGRGPIYRSGPEYSYKNATRSLAIYSMIKTGRVYPDMVIPTVYSVYRNTAENTEVRIAAFNVFMNLHPSLSYLQMAAINSYYEIDSEVKKVVYNTFKSVADDHTFVTGVNSPQANFAKNCQLLLPVVAKTPGPFSSSGYITKSSYAPRLGAGYKGIFAWISDYKSVIPSEVYASVISLFGNKYATVPFEMAFKVSGTEKFFSPAKMSEIFEGSRMNLRARVGGRYSSESRRSVLLATSTTDEWDPISKAHFEKVKDNLHQEWAKVIETLKIETRRGGPLSAMIYLNLFDDMTFFASISELTDEIIAKYASNYVQKMDKICGSTPFTYQRLVNVAAQESMIPTDMGFPLYVEKNTPTLITLQGKIDLKCDRQAPSAVLSMKAATAVNYHAHYGIYSPFTQEALVVGLKQDLVLNLPVETTLAFDPRSGSFKASVKITESSLVDMVYMRTLPFSTVAPIASFTPMCMSKQLKPIKSSVPLKSIEVNVGQSLGLNVKSHLDVEVSHLDASYALNVASLFGYNPIHLAKHFMAPRVLNEMTNRPSLRYSLYKLTFDAANSANKGAEVVIEAGLASTSQNTGSYYYALGEIPYNIVQYPLDSAPRDHAERQTAIKKLMVDQLGLIRGVGGAVIMHAKLEGSDPKQVSYKMVFAGGRNKAGIYHVETQVNEQSSPQNKVCIRAQTKTLYLPIWDAGMSRSMDLSVDFKSHVAVGANCERKYVKVSGNARVGNHQKYVSKHAPYAHQCRRMLDLGVPGSFFSYVCRQTRYSAKTIDEMNFKIQYLERMPTVHYLETGVIRGFQAYLWPYAREVESHSPRDHGVNYETAIKMKFHSESETMDLVLTRPEDHVAFRHIRYPISLHSFLPINMSPISGVKEGLRDVVGPSADPVCLIEKSWLRTYDNVSLPFVIDDCFHLISADCANSFEYGVLARNVRPRSIAKEVKIYLNKTEIIMTPTSDYTQVTPHMKIRVDGVEVNVEKTQYKTFMMKEDKESVWFVISKSIDGVIVLDVPSSGYRIRFDGVRMALNPPRWVKNTLCGLCGDNNNQQKVDFRGPQGCIYSRPELSVAAYRLPSDQCAKLRPEIREELVKETETCARYIEYPTEVVKGFYAIAGKCTNKHHMILERGQEVCFSKIPVIQCGAQCSPKPHKLSSKEIGFTCMKAASRIGQLYREKVIQGQILPELANKNDDFMSTVLVPQECAAVSYEQRN